MKAIVLGGSGLIGSLLIDKLLDLSSSVDAPVRRIVPQNCQQMMIKSLSDLDHIKTDADILFYCLGTTKQNAGNAYEFEKIEMEMCKHSIHLIKNNKIKRIILLSSFGTDENAKGVYLKTKFKIECLFKNEFSDRLVIFKPSLLIGKRDEHRPAEFVGQKIAKAFSLFIPAKYQGVPANTLVSKMVTLAESNFVGTIENEEILN